MEKSIAELNKSMEKLFNSFEDQRQISMNNQKAIANLLIACSRGKMTAEKESDHKQKAPEYDNATSSRKEPRGEDNSHDRYKFKKVEMPAFDGEQPDDWLFRAE